MRHRRDSLIHMRRGRLLETGVCIVSALAVVAVHLWTGQPTLVAQPNDAIVLRVYYLRRLNDNERRFFKAFDTPVSPDAASRSSGSNLCFSNSPTTRKSAPNAYSNAALVLTQTSSFAYEWDCEAGGWLAVRASVEDHARIQTLLQALEALR